MAKTIREMAIQYAPHPANNNWNEMQKQLVKLSAYEAGANYVLEQIEKLTNNQNWCAFPKQSHKELKELITKLKGK